MSQQAHFELFHTLDTCVIDCNIICTVCIHHISIYRIRPSILADDPVRSLCTGAKRMGGLFSWWKASQREAKTECEMIDLTDYRQTCSFPIILCLAFDSMPAFLVPQRLGFLSQAFF